MLDGARDRTRGASDPVSNLLRSIEARGVFSLYVPADARPPCPKPSHLAYMWLMRLSHHSVDLCGMNDMPPFEARIRRASRRGALSHP